eukprot:CAMPEP_0196719210 /NCGR_PEP_ID=MMETSP1091-20130531/2262_1 /TAXON_ID=302021 /ORGANISM="Rhodomonas sp., Strain CCMP768" /LENGTH=82 /DNA_ID=CAMNT_0042060117 /DNA_START=13 /DNA_END=261 /DNA_ORIENTATION=-
MPFSLLAPPKPDAPVQTTELYASVVPIGNVRLTPTACYQRADQHISKCHGAMKAMGISVGKNGQLVITNKNRFTTSKEPSQV